MVSAARSRRIRFTFIIQNFAQLNQVYSKEIAETIKGNCGNIIYLISSELTALEEISKMCGELKSKEKDKTDSRPLVTVSDLQRLPQWTMIVLRIRNMPFKTVMTPDFKMNNNNMWDRKLDTADYPLREKQSVGLFDIKDYVRESP
jgi:type IV secretory pathway TraG/TraD family ATPase VirD4